MKNIKLIGALHLLPTVGYSGFTNLESIIAKAEKDALAFQSGGMNAIIVENNYDLPHQITVGPEVVATMNYVIEYLKNCLEIPFGISVLWNDYKAALSMAKVLDCMFVRIPVFVDKVRTSYGIIQGDAAEVIRYRKMIKAEKVQLLTDIHVKHAELLSKHSLLASAKLAINAGSDGIILTGKWTGDAPGMQEIISVRKRYPNFPLYVGSGADENNVASLLQLVDGVIVGTSLKTGKNSKKHVNIRGSKEVIDVHKVKSFVRASKKIL